MPDRSREKTVSTRIYEEQFDLVKERLDDRDFKLSHLQRFSIELATVEDDEAAEEYLDLVEEFHNEREATFGECVEHFLEENPSYADRVVDAHAERPAAEIDRERVEEGVKKMLSGVYFRDSREAMTGGRMLDEIDTSLGDTAVQYLSRFPGDYWQQ
ncbi:MAG: hypothetical protein ABEJ91_04400 [Candidatus Nanohaloarchaea archaeon]